MHKVYIERSIAGLAEELRNALLLSTAHTYAESARILGIEIEDLIDRIRRARHQVVVELLGEQWRDAESQYVIDIQIDASAMRMQRRLNPEGVARRVHKWLKRRARETTAALVAGMGRPVLVPVASIATIAMAVVLYDAVSRMVGPNESAEISGPARGEAAVPDNAVPVGGTASAPMVPLVAGANQEGISLADHGVDEEKPLSERWKAMEEEWGAFTSRVVDIGEVEADNKILEGLRTAMEGFWRRDANGQDSMEFRRQLEGFLQTRTGGGMEEYCAAASQWRVAWGTQGRRVARERELEGVEARRRELEVVRREVDVRKRELEVERKGKEARRLAVEARRRMAEVEREALEARSAPGSEMYWKELINYERLLEEEYIAVFDSEMKTFAIRYNDFMNNTYIPGQWYYNVEMAKVLVGYSVLLWGCEADRIPTDSATARAGAAAGATRFPGTLPSRDGSSATSAAVDKAQGRAGN